ncbi:hypothetical protein GGX14DRAFT_392467 [Mycena pura]|uniref:Uncharacterized protein n=1 Tax=Mycena pura TaxID=153505 RepID=A0AAD6VRL2_9AGAR|nr:hypothetical protein GGX14DRAFT_392467 [Mycena pura]
MAGTNSGYIANQRGCVDYSASTPKLGYKSSQHHYALSDSINIAASIIRPAAASPTPPPARPAAASPTPPPALSPTTRRLSYGGSGERRAAGGGQWDRQRGRRRVVAGRGSERRAGSGKGVAGGGRRGRRRDGQPMNTVAGTRRCFVGDGSHAPGACTYARQRPRPPVHLTVSTSNGGSLCTSRAPSVGRSPCARRAAGPLSSRPRSPRRRRHSARWAAHAAGRSGLDGTAGGALGEFDDKGRMECFVQVTRPHNVISNGVVTCQEWYRLVT